MIFYEYNHMSKTLIKLTCHYCKKPFTRRAANHKQRKPLGHNAYCSIECGHKGAQKRITILCTYCNKTVIRNPHDFKKSKTGKFFCNTSCAASFNNTLKRPSRRSKVEKMLYGLLVNEFPHLNIIANDKTMLNGLEADIAIPSLKLAIEWNGIVHFKPIYGKKKLQRVQDLDRKKQTIAANNNINLIVIPDLVSSKKQVIDAFNKIKNIINNLLSS